MIYRVVYDDLYHCTLPDPVNPEMHLITAEAFPAGERSWDK